MISRPPTNSPIPSYQWDVIVIGAGAAGLMTCLELPKNLKVLLLNRNTSRRSSSRWAQGGIAAVTRKEDSLNSHAEDTIKAGAGLCDGDAVRLLVKEAPNCVSRLQELGMEFDREGMALSTTLEAAHSHRRVLHVQDRTGRALVDVLQEQVEQRNNLLHRRGVRVTQLWVEENRCCGVQVLDGHLFYWISARAVVLASGGGGHLFANTTNPAQACGEGIALAWNAGAAVEDLEFVQFHPTALKLEGAPCFLLSEALRGEGAKLVDSKGKSPVEKLIGKDLAPRDQVSRALVESMAKQKVQSVGLDLKPIRADLAERRFPTILQRIRDLGLDPINQLIPIAPAAHYWMGGVATDLKASTTLNGLYAVGEVACTGVHGANRLASNSLMECLVFAKQLASIKLSELNQNHDLQDAFKSEPEYIQIDSSKKASLLSQEIEHLRNLCWQKTGVDRSPHGMQSALKLIKESIQEINEDPLLKIVHNQSKGKCNALRNDTRTNLNLLLDLSHRQQTTRLLLEACLFRKESRGGHFRTDAPQKLPQWECHSRNQIHKGLSTRPVKE